MQEKIKLLDYEFEYVQDLSPVRNKDGKIKLFNPEKSYKNNKGHNLNKYGQGPFCRFSINPKWEGVSGVYAFFIGNELSYIGQCLNFLQRFNIGYGNISPRCCYEGGQSTNCKMNKVVLDAYQKGNTVDLYFHTTTNYDQVEYKLIQHFKPMFNDARTSAPKEQSEKTKTYRPDAKNKAERKISNCSKKEVVGYIQRIFQAERAKGNKSVVLSSGDIHKELGLSHALPTVCHAMYDLKKASDRILHTTPSGLSSTIKIEYFL